MSDRKDFMGIPIAGNYGGWARAVQQPIEDLYPYFKEAFDKGIKAVKWEQYTPGWNDGEPCEFSISDVKFTANSEIAQAWLDSDDPDYDVIYPNHGYRYFDEENFMGYGEHPDGNEFKNINLPVAEGRFEDALRGVFGNDTQVVVTPERVVQFEWDCGY